MKDEKKKHVPFSIEVKIRDSKGRTVWKWHDSRGNLLFGLEKTNEYAKTLLGLDNRQLYRSEPEPEPKPDTNIRRNEQRNISFIERAFGKIEPIEPIFGVKRGGERK